MAVVWIPSLLQGLTAGEEKVSVSGATIGDIIDQLEARFPGVRERLVERGELRPHIAVAIDGDVSPEGLEQVVLESSEIHFIPALSGGSEVFPLRYQTRCLPPILFPTFDDDASAHV